MGNALKSLLFAALVTALGCQSSHSSAGFRLPPDGDVERGKTAFVALACHICHEVDGVSLPKPPAARQISVLLGGPLGKTMTDGYLVTSIIYPAYERAQYLGSEIKSDGVSMPHYADRLTVQQMVDIVAFLQSRYCVRAMLPEGHSPAEREPGPSHPVR